MVNNKEAKALQRRIQADGFSRVFVAESGTRHKRWLVLLENVGTFASPQDYEAWQSKRTERGGTDE